MLETFDMSRDVIDWLIWSDPQVGLATSLSPAQVSPQLELPWGLEDGLLLRPLLEFSCYRNAKKKPAKRLYFLAQLKGARVPPEELVQFYVGCIQLVLLYGYLGLSF